MELELKKRILDYLRRTADCSANREPEDERRDLITRMETEVNCIDINTHTICIEDLEDYDSPELRKKLGKTAGEDYTIEDCVTVSEAIADYICEDFGEDFANAVKFVL